MLSILYIVCTLFAPVTLLRCYHCADGLNADCNSSIFGTLKECPELPNQVCSYSFMNTTKGTTVARSCLDKEDISNIDGNCSISEASDGSFINCLCSTDACNNQTLTAPFIPGTGGCVHLKNSVIVLVITSLFGLYQLL